MNIEQKIAKKELYIQHNTKGVEIALTEDNVLVELHNESAESQIKVGDIFLAKPRKILPGLNAAFIQLGIEKDAFIHYSDLGPQFKNIQEFTEQCVSSKQAITLDNVKTENILHKVGNIVNVLPKKTLILVQVVKEPINSKGPRLTGELSLAGRYLVLVPFNNQITISKKIADTVERNRLIEICKKYVPKNIGVIIRTAAENRNDNDIKEDIEDLFYKWQSIVTQLTTATVGTKIYAEGEKSIALLRDMLNDSFQSIYTNNETIYNEVKRYINQKAPYHNIEVSLYKGKATLFDAYSLNTQIKSSLGKTVTLNNGSYLIIEKTEALHVIDVNSGHRMIQKSQDEAAAEINEEATKEIARQIRLRDLGGIIVIDFIDVKNQEFKNSVFNKLRDAMQPDKARHTILPLSKFSICQITRERSRPEVVMGVEQQCYECKGSGKNISNDAFIINQIEGKVKRLARDSNLKSITLKVHPWLHVFLKQKCQILQWKWLLTWGKWIKILPDKNLSPSQFIFYNKDLEEIRF